MGECFSDRVHEIPEEDIVIVGGDFNAHLGRDRIGFEDVLGKFTIGDRNTDGEELLQLCQQNNLKILNTWFEKQEKHLITYVSGDSESQIDFILMRKEKESVIKVKDCKTFPSEQCATQHKLLCADFLITDFKRPKRRRGEKKIKIWKLKEKIYHDEYKRKLIEKMDNNKEGWNDYKTACIEAAKEVCGENNRGGVAIAVRKSWEENIIEVNNYSSRMIKIKLVCGKKIIHFFSAYAPQSGRSNKEKLDFRECLSDRVHEIPEEDIVIVGGDFNAHLGRERIGFEDVLGKFTIGDRNADGEELLQLCQQNNLKILNTWFE